MKLSFSVLLLILLAAPAQAYIGPGPGLSMINSLFTLVGGIIFSVLLVLAYPIRLLLKRMKKNAPKKPDEK